VFSLFNGCRSIILIQDSRRTGVVASSSACKGQQWWRRAGGGLPPILFGLRGNGGDGGPASSPARTKNGTRVRMHVFRQKGLKNNRRPWAIGDSDLSRRDGGSRTGEATTSTWRPPSHQPCMAVEVWAVSWYKPNLFSLPNQRACLGSDAKPTQRERARQPNTHVVEAAATATGRPRTPAGARHDPSLPAPAIVRPHHNPHPP
jgi:hypothetical protein